MMRLLLLYSITFCSVNAMDFLLWPFKKVNLGAQETLVNAILKRKPMDIADALIDADVNTPFQRMLPLEYAALVQADAASVGLLLQAGARVDTQCCDGKTIFQKSIEFLDDYGVQLIKMMPREDEKLDEEYEQERSRVITLRNTYANIATMLAQATKYPDTKVFAYKWTPLLVAANHNCDGLARELLMAGANPNFMSQAQSTALDFALSRNNSIMAQMLLRAGARVIDFPECEHPLIRALQKKMKFAALLMLDDPTIDINVTGRDTGKSALLVSLETMQLEVALKLLEKSARITVPPHIAHVSNPLIKALEHGYKQVAERLLYRGANPNQGCNLQPLDPEQVQKMIQACELPQLKAEMWAPLLLAVYKKLNPTLLELLFKKGADPRVKLQDGRSALHLAAEYEHVDAIPILLRHRNCINDFDESGFTPLHYACRSNLLIALELLRHGARINAQDPRRQGPTPLHVAILANQIAIVAALCERKADTGIAMINGKNAWDLVHDKKGTAAHAALSALMQNSAPTPPCWQPLTFEALDFIKLEHKNGHCSKKHSTITSLLN